MGVGLCHRLCCLAIGLTPHARGRTPIEDPLPPHVHVANHQNQEEGKQLDEPRPAKIAQRDSRLVEMYLFVAVVYFVLCYTLSFFVKRLQKRIAVIR